MSLPPIKVFVIEDNPADVRLVAELLNDASGGPFQVSTADRLDKGLERLAAEDFDILLLDLDLPDSTGLETAEKALAGFPSLPVIIMSGLADEETATSAVRAGAQDYLIKGTAGADLLGRSIIHAIERKKSELALLAAIEEAEERRRETEKLAVRLSLLHDIGLTLNRETDKYRLLKAVLASACELTSSGVGALMLTQDGVTELVDTHYADWYADGCSMDFSGPIHQSVGRLVPEDLNTVRIDFERDSNPFPIPEDHPQLTGLLMGVISDPRGTQRGYFMLSHKAGDESFTVDDEQVVALLAAQSSVALTSAENFERQHTVAETLQSALLPAIPKREEFDIGLIYSSASLISRLGGDFYDFVDLDSGAMAVVIGDVSGKGLEAATETAMVKYMLRAYLIDFEDPGECLTKLNEAAFRQLTMEKFITVGLMVIDLEAGRLSYSSAGHPHPLLCVEGMNLKLQSGASLPVGVLPGHRFETTIRKISSGASVLMYTDGLIEARPAGEAPFGEDRAMKAMAEVCGQPAQTMAEKIRDAALDYSGGNLKDDIALLVLKIT